MARIRRIRRSDERDDGKRIDDDVDDVHLCPHCDEETLKRSAGSRVWRCGQCNYSEDRGE